MAKPRKLSDKMQLFCDNYMANGGNGTAAATDAGYAHGFTQASRLLKHPAIKAEIGRHRNKIREKYELNEEWVIQRLMRIADSGKILAKYRIPQPDGSLAWDFGNATAEDLEVISEMTVETYMEGRGAAAVEVKKFKIGVESAKGALDSLARKLGLFNDKVTVGFEADLVARLQKGRERAGKE